MKSIFYCVFLLSLFLAISCHKHDDHGHGDDKSTPVIILTSPTDGQVVNGALRVVGKVTDNSLHALTIKVVRDSDSKVLSENKPSVHNKTEYSFDVGVSAVGVSGETPMTVEIIVEDHGGNKATNTRKFIWKP